MLTAACFGFNMGARPTGSRVCTPTMTAADDYNLLVSRFGSQVPSEEVSRRSALQLGAAAMAALPLASFVSPAMAADGMFSLPPLPYAYVSIAPLFCAPLFCRRSSEPCTPALLVLRTRWSRTSTPPR
jgi:hypothetical protein